MSKGTILDIACSDTLTWLEKIKPLVASEHVGDSVEAAEEQLETHKVSECILRVHDVAKEGLVVAFCCVLLL